MSNYDNHDDTSIKDLINLKAISEKTREELVVIQTLLKTLNESLFGERLYPGIITKLERKDAELEARLTTHDRLIWICLGVIVTMSFLSGSGTVTLKTLIGH